MSTNPNTDLFQRAEQLSRECNAKAREISAAIKLQVKSGNESGPNKTARILFGELVELRKELSREINSIQQRAGISESEIQQLEDWEANRVPKGSEFWQREILQLRETEDLDSLVESGLDKLLEITDQIWLREEAKKNYRLGSTFVGRPLHLVNGVRVGVGSDPPTPQRFANMLLVSEDHIQKNDHLDFHAAAAFVPEIAALGNSLDEIRELGPEAEKKLRALPSMPDDMVTSTIFELLVGAACIRHGLKVRMLEENHTHKSPDFRVEDLPIPCAIECKRRLGLTMYELTEANLVEQLYLEIRKPLLKQGIHSIIELSFSDPVHSIPREKVVETVVEVALENRNAETFAAEWGTLAVRRVPFWSAIDATRLYSPDFLKQVFSWEPAQSDWDGLVCEVEDPSGIIVERAKSPLCLKWRSESAEALTKKARGITSLWAKAVKQIPDGEVGFVYIAYPEGAREPLADARTSYIVEYMGKNLWHRWSVLIPVTVVIRLYARAVGAGCPHLIENALAGAQTGEEFWLKLFPSRVFTWPCEQR
jgi:hypothetical protein